MNIKIKVLTLVLLSLGIIAPAFAVDDCRPSDTNQNFRQIETFANQTLTEIIQAELAGKIKDYSIIPKERHLLFVPGVMNEPATAIFPNYYIESRQQVKKMGMTTSYWPIISSQSIPENAERLYEKINTLYDRVKKPIVLVGHSMGAASIRQCVLMHPDLILDGKVDTSILFQTAGGSPLADGKFSRPMRLVQMLFQPHMKTLSSEQAKKDLDDALDHFNSYFRNDPDAEKKKKLISDKLGYVTSTMQPNQYGLGLKVVLGVLQKELTFEKSNDGIHPLSSDHTGNAKYSGRHDGLLPIETQSDPRIGKIIGEVDSDHVSLVVRAVGNFGSAHREAVMRASLLKRYRDSPSAPIRSKL
jgi:hypothetical protein